MDEEVNHYQIVENAFSDELLDQIAAEIGAHNIDVFRIHIKHAVFSLIHVLDINKGRHVIPSEKKKVFKKIYEDFQSFNLLFKEMDKITIMHQAFYEALGNIARDIPEEKTQLLHILSNIGDFRPQTTGFRPDVIKEFFNAIENSFEKLDEYELKGGSYTDIERETKHNFALAFKTIWLRHTQYQFSLGEYINGIYVNNRPAEILQSIVSRVIKGFSVTEAQTLIRKVT